MAEVTSLTTLSDGVKNATIAILEQIRTHKLKGSELIVNGLDMLSKGLELAGEVKEQLSAWTEVLKSLIAMLKPVFETIRDWIKEAWQHLLELFDWCKEMWNKLFN